MADLRVLSVQPFLIMSNESLHNHLCACSVCPGQSRDMSRQLGDSHRRFLQTMMTVGIVDEPGARALYQHCCETHNSKSLYVHTV